MTHPLSVRPWLLAATLGLFLSCGGDTTTEAPQSADAPEVPDAPLTPADTESMQQAATGSLPPIRPECANRQGGGDCWGEWLKITGSPMFSPVAVGSKGFGPWPTADLTRWTVADGLPSTGLRGVGTDLGGNIWAVDDGAVYLLQPGQTRWSSWARNTSGLRDYRLLSVAGGPAGVAFVGYEGVWGLDLNNEPADIRKSGDLQRLTLLPDGTLQIRTYDTHNSNTPVSGKYDHARSIYEIVVPRRGAAAGELFLGTEHGLVRYQGDVYADHAHVFAMVNGSQRFGAARGLSVADDGTAWYGNAFKIGGRPWTPRLYEWYFVSNFQRPMNVFDAETDRDDIEGIAFDPQKNVWVASATKGLARVARNLTITRWSVPARRVDDLLLDTDGRLLLGTRAGLLRFTPATGTFETIGGITEPVFDLYMDDTVTPRTVWAATTQGIVAWRGH